MWLDWHNHIKQLQIEQSEQGPAASQESDQKQKQPTTEEKPATNQKGEIATSEDASAFPFVSVVMTHFNRPHLLKVPPRMCLKVQFQVVRSSCTDR